ncbi:putative AC9 transposase [Bienertia sinuspersici]
MAVVMKKKFNKYWGNVDKMNNFIYAASILDPHVKYVVVEVTLIEMHGREKGMKLANDVKEFTYTLFDEYANMYSDIPQDGQQGNTMSLDLDSSKKVGGDGFMNKMKEKAKRLKGSSGYAMCELDWYFNEQLGNNEVDLDALTWWGGNAHRYPILSCLARDILAIPLSTVASESAFSTGGRTLDPFRSSLSPKVMSHYFIIYDIMFALFVSKYNFFIYMFCLCFKDGSSLNLFTRLAKVKGSAYC